MGPWSVQKERKGKEEYLCSAFLHQGTHKALRHGSHSFTCKQHHACLSFVSVHQMSPPQQVRQQTSNCSSLLIYRPRKDERLSWPSWLTYSGWLTHISGQPSATSRAQDSESTSAKDQCSTAGPRHQQMWSRDSNPYILSFSITLIRCLATPVYGFHTKQCGNSGP